MRGLTLDGIQIWNDKSSSGGVIFTAGMWSALHRCAESLAEVRIGNPQEDYEYCTLVDTYETDYCPHPLLHFHPAAFIFFLTPFFWAQRSPLKMLRKSDCQRPVTTTAGYLCRACASALVAYSHFTFSSAYLLISVSHSSLPMQI